LGKKGEKVIAMGLGGKRSSYIMRPIEKSKGAKEVIRGKDVIVM